MAWAILLKPSVRYIILKCNNKKIKIKIKRKKKKRERVNFNAQLNNMGNLHLLNNFGRLMRKLVINHCASHETVLGRLREKVEARETGFEG